MKWSAVAKALATIPGLVKQAAAIPGLVEQVAAIPDLVKQTAAIPGLVQQITDLRQQLADQKKDSQVSATEQGDNRGTLNARAVFPIQQPATLSRVRTHTFLNKALHPGMHACMHACTETRPWPGVLYPVAVLCRSCSHSPRGMHAHLASCASVMIRHGTAMVLLRWLICLALNMPPWCTSRARARARARVAPGYAMSALGHTSCRCKWPLTRKDVGHLFVPRHTGYDWHAVSSCSECRQAQHDTCAGYGAGQCARA